MYEANRDRCTSIAWMLKLSWLKLYILTENSTENDRFPTQKFMSMNDVNLSSANNMTPTIWWLMLFWSTFDECILINMPNFSHTETFNGGGKPAGALMIWFKGNRRQSCQNLSESRLIFIPSVHGIPLHSSTARLNSDFARLTSANEVKPDSLSEYSSAIYFHIVLLHVFLFGSVLCCLSYHW